MKHFITVSGCDDSTTVPIELTDEELVAVKKFAAMVNAADTYSCTPSIHFGADGTEEDLINEYEERVKEAKEQNQ